MVFLEDLSANFQNEPIQEGYRRPLLHALQWYELLVVRVKREARRRLAVARDEVTAQSVLAEQRTTQAADAASDTATTEPTETEGELLAAVLTKMS